MAVERPALPCRLPPATHSLQKSSGICGVPVARSAHGLAGWPAGIIVRVRQVDLIWPMQCARRGGLPSEVQLPQPQS